MAFRSIEASTAATPRGRRIPNSPLVPNSFYTAADTATIRADPRRINRGIVARRSISERATPEDAGTSSEELCDGRSHFGCWRAAVCGILLCTFAKRSRHLPMNSVFRSPASPEWKINPTCRSARSIRLLHRWAAGLKLLPTCRAAT